MKIKTKKIIIKNCHKIISRIRLIKEKHEISNLVKAIEIAEKSLENTLGFVREGSYRNTNNFLNLIHYFEKKTQNTHIHQL